MRRAHDGSSGGSLSAAGAPRAGSDLLLQRLQFGLPFGRNDGAVTTGQLPQRLCDAQQRGQAAHQSTQGMFFALKRLQIRRNGGWSP